MMNKFHHHQNINYKMLENYNHMANILGEVGAPVHAAEGIANLLKKRREA